MIQQCVVVSHLLCMWNAMTAMSSHRLLWNDEDISTMRLELLHAQYSFWSNAVSHVQSLILGIP